MVSIGLAGDCNHSPDPPTRTANGLRIWQIPFWLGLEMILFLQLRDWGGEKSWMEAPFLHGAKRIAGIPPLNGPILHGSIAMASPLQPYFSLPEQKLSLQRLA
jgi:hypothetical protein